MWSEVSRVKIKCITNFSVTVTFSIIKYWRDVAADNLQTVKNLFSLNKYVNAVKS